MKIVACGVCHTDELAQKDMFEELMAEGKSIMGVIESDSHNGNALKEVLRME